MKKLFCIAALFTVVNTLAQNPSTVFPHPQRMELAQQRFAVQQPYTVVGNLPPGELALLNGIVQTGNKAGNRLFEIKKLESSDPQQQRSGAYRLLLSPQKLTVEAVDQRSVFYALQTLRQLVQKNSKGETTLPAGEITDYPDVAFRGTVEGFYGEPWSHQDRLAQLRFYGRFKLNTYIYGPKDDPYHSSPHWRDGYPAEKAAQLKALVGEAKRNRVDFVWAIHPGKDIQWNREDSNAVLQKFEKMYVLGVRSFAVFFDDISGAGTDARKQAGLLNFLQQQFVEGKKDVTPLIMCPTEYNKAWSNPKEGTYLDILGEHLHPAIQVMWTGNSVVADNTTEGLQWVNKRIRRPAFVWWNFPVSDYVRDHLLLGPAYGLDATAAPHMSGFVSNPMDKAEASKLAIFSIADYSWNLQRCNPQEAWLAAIREVMPEAPGALELFASHNSDLGPNGHLYRRAESVHIKPVVDLFVSLYNRNVYSKKLASEIEAEFTRLLPVANAIKSKSQNKRLVEQLSPWLLQFELLAKSGVQAVKTAGNLQVKNHAVAWRHYLQTATLLDSMSKVDQSFNQNPYQPGVKTASLVLMPLIKTMHEKAAQRFERGGKEARAAFLQNCDATGSVIYTNNEKLRHQPLRASNGQIAVSPLLEVVTLAPGEYLGLQLHPGLKPLALHLHLESNSLQTWGCFDASANGENWQAFTVSEKRGKGMYHNLEETVRFVRFSNTSDKPQPLYLREFRLDVVPATGADQAIFAVDGSVGTWQAFSKKESIRIPLPATLQNSPLSLLLKPNGAAYTITGIRANGSKSVLYKGNAPFVRLGKAINKNITVLELSTATEQPVLLYDVLTWAK